MVWHEDMDEDGETAGVPSLIECRACEALQSMFTEYSQTVAGHAGDRKTRRISENCGFHGWRGAASKTYKSCRSERRSRFRTASGETAGVPNVETRGGGPFTALPAWSAISILAHALQLYRIADDIIRHIARGALWQRS